MAQCGNTLKYTKSRSFVAIMGASNEKLFMFCESLRDAGVSVLHGRFLYKFSIQYNLKTLKEIFSHSIV